MYELVGLIAYTVAGFVVMSLLVLLQPIADAIKARRERS